MALGIPAVGSSIPSYKEIITDGDNGFLAIDKADWYNKLERLIVDPQLRSDIGKRAVETARNFSVDIIGDMWNRLLLNANGGRQHHGRQTV